VADPTVGLDDQPLRSPEEVDAVAQQRDLDVRSRQVVQITHSEEAFLELAIGDGAAGQVGLKRRVQAHAGNAARGCAR
jgi:hypothetical protein